MKKLSLALTVLALLATALPALASGSQSWTGWITDDHCGAKGANAKHTPECVEKCAKNGKVMFFNEGDKKLYGIDKTAEAVKMVGSLVKITGQLEGETIKVEKVEKAAA
jgi:hypothetical protein